MTDASVRIWRRPPARRLLPLAPSLLFLAFFLVPVLAQATTWWYVVLAVGAALVVAVGFLGISMAVTFPLAARAWYLAAFSVATFAVCWPFAGTYTLAMGTYLTVAAALLLPWIGARIVIPVFSVAVLVAGIVLQQWWLVMLAVIGAGIGLSMAFGIRSGQLREELDAAQERIATLAVAAERERIARDLHDILGHSLTAVVVKSGLAVRLADADPTLAREQMSEVETIARQALADVRATAAGFRLVRLASEIAGARSVLSAAEITATTPEALPAMSDDASEFLGWVVREGVTNVVRHSGAQHCAISVDGRSVTVADDGTGVDPSAATAGHGLSGLRERAAALGATVELSPAEPHGTVLTVTLPEQS